ncbi:hypothetical protein [Pseudomonas auratipiscis]|uniref:Uncharacterized protein n=1 Tax=Pseudomonas auratipiscis TaxID=3115853 RepID=A0AB35X2T5_9PSED|nr:hypothetical protein [Pseudomonas sp. 120P]MEE1869984.1 hypothetical protein [Pseudomonas sp. 120P]
MNRRCATGCGASRAGTPAFEEALVRGRVPEQDTSLFIALDDPLALVDDLSMNLAGRLMEQDQFSRLHQANLESALAVQHLCGFDTEAFIPERIKDPIQRQAYTDDLYTLLKTFDQVERGKELVSFGQEGMVDLASARTVAAAQSAFPSAGRMEPLRSGATAMDGRRAPQGQGRPFGAVPTGARVE